MKSRIENLKMLKINGWTVFFLITIFYNFCYYPMSKLVLGTLGGDHWTVKIDDGRLDGHLRI